MFVWVLNTLNTPLEDSLSSRCQKPIMPQFTKNVSPNKNYYEHISEMVFYIYSLYMYIYIYLYIWLTISSCYGSIPLILGLIGRDGGLSTLCHSCGFACQQRVLKTFPGPGYLRSKDGVV